jgi:hypothetical protein
MEITKVQKEDMIWDQDFLHIKVPAFKHGERAGPLKIKRTNPGLDLVFQQYEKIKPKHPVWPIKKSTAYNIITRALGICPHWLRHNFISSKQRNLAGTPSEVDETIQSWTGIRSRATLDNYRLKIQKDIDKIAEMEV